MDCRAALAMTARLLPKNPFIGLRRPFTDTA
jgi:hypothetical protein